MMIAREHGLSAGHYELVVEYKFGLGRLAEEEGPVGAMAVTFGGLGLRRVENESPMSIEVGGGSGPRKKVASPAPGKSVKKATK